MKKINFQKVEKFQKLSLLDLAAARVKHDTHPVQANPGDLIEIIEPFTPGENLYGIVISCDDKFVTVYHSDVRKTISWNRRVNCNVSHL